MGFKQFASLKLCRLFVVNTVGLTILAAMACPAQADGVVCTSKSERKYVAVEFVGSGGKYCRTVYSNGVSATREIAWGRNGTKKCDEVASRLLAKLNRAGMNCGAGIHTDTTTPIKASRKRIAESTAEDDALLKSINK